MSEGEEYNSDEGEEEEEEEGEEEVEDEDGAEDKADTGMHPRPLRPLSLAANCLRLLQNRQSASRKEGQDRSCR